MVAVPTYVSITSSTPLLWFNAIGTNSTASCTTSAYPGTLPTTQLVPYVPDVINLNDGKARTLKMADGTVIKVSRDGSFEVNDANAKVIYRGCPTRDFNPFLNASDKLEDFIKFCGDAGVRQGDMLGIPLKHFIAWLVIEAAKADGDPEPDMLPLLPDLRQPRCPSCGRFISARMKAARIEFCRPACFETRLLEYHSQDKRASG